MNFYLSIDLDYWQYETPERAATFFRRVWQLGLPIFVVPFHELLLAHVNESGCNHLINIDYHSDVMSSPNLKDIGEGNWVNFVGFRSCGKYEWRYPTVNCLSHWTGLCHDENEIDPFASPEVAGWQTIKRREAAARIPWRRIAAVGVCLSVDYMGPFELTASIVRRLGIEKWLRMDRIERRTEAQPFLFSE